ncbi:MAG: hypothetical protein ACFFDN_51610 [Candidatus Hodarchaeota archaeon]
MVKNNKKSEEKAIESKLNDTNSKGQIDKSKLFTEIRNLTRDKIDKLKEKNKTTISQIIEDAIEIYDNYESIAPEVRSSIEKYEEEYGGWTSVVEAAIKLLESQKDPEKSEDIDLWCRMRDEMHMVALGKTTFNQLLAAAAAPEERLDKPMRKNIGKDIIMWYTGKPIKSLTLEEIIGAIEKVWRSANFFYIIDVKKENNDQFHVIFRHNQNERYSLYWLGYFEELFSSEDLSFKCILEGEAFGESLSLIIKKAYNKNQKKK